MQKLHLAQIVSDKIFEVVNECKSGVKFRLVLFLMEYVFGCVSNIEKKK